MPVAVMDEFEAICRDYLWGGVAMNQRKALVAWDQICRPLKEGGLGVMKFRWWNIALIFKLIWDIA